MPSHGLTDKRLVGRILGHWRLSDCRWRPLAKVVKVESGEGEFCLKPVRKSQDRLLFMHRVQEHVRDRGFTRLGFLRLTGGGAIAVWEDGLAWTLSEWLPGRELAYGRTAEIAIAAATLARFHAAGEDFRAPPGRRQPASNIGKWPAKVASRCGELLCAARAAHARRRDQFQAELAAQLPALSAHAQRSLSALTEPAYARRSRATQETLPICHGDPAAHNFVLGPDGSVALIDLNSLRADLPCIDLWKLLHRLGSHVAWEPAALGAVFDAYAAVRPLDAVERRVLAGLLWLPEKQWRLTYKAGRCLTEDDASWRDASTGELAAAGRAMPAKEACLEALEERLLGSQG